jgi:hypothetical protein
MDVEVEDILFFGYSRKLIILGGSVIDHRTLVKQDSQGEAFPKLWSNESDHIEFVYVCNSSLKLAENVV